MASYTNSLRLVQPATGEYSGTWGTQVNNGITALVDSAVAGAASITMTAANYTLTVSNGASDESRAMFLVLGGTPGGSYQVIVPAVSKLYFVTNSTGAAQTVKTAAGTGISVPNGAQMALRCDGANVVAAVNYFGSLTLGAALPVGSGGTGATTLAGANIPVTNAPNTFTGTQTFNGSSSALAAVLTDAAEVCTISATAATGTINYDITTQSVLYYTSNASANWTVNFRASSGTSLNTALATGQSVTVAFLVTQGSTAYYNNAVQVDGSSVTPKWQGGTAPSAGNTSSIDAYTYTIVKTAAATFTVFASQTRFA